MEWAVGSPTRLESRRNAKYGWKRSHRVNIAFVSVEVRDFFTAIAHCRRLAEAHTRKRTSLQTAPWRRSKIHLNAENDRWYPMNGWSIA
jgi:hypothetical protein